jgi:hypothetical protein
VAIAAALGAILGLHELAGRIHPEPLMWLGQRYDTVDLGLSRIHTLPDEPDRRAVVYFGDSTVAEYEKGPPLPRLTAMQLNQRRGRPWVRMLNVSAPGAGIVQYGFLADHVASFEPDLVIWQLSYFQLTERWTTRNGAPELVGFVAGSRLPEIILLPVEHYGLSLADILLQQAIVRLGLHDLHAWMRQGQLRFGHVIERAEDVLNPNRGRKPEARARRQRGRRYMLRHMDMELRKRYSAYGERVHFGATLDGLDDDHPKLALLRSGLRALTGRGIDVLVYLNPTNLDHLEATGAGGGEGLRRTTRAIERVVAESGAHFLDLTRLLDDADFADAAGHFVEDDEQTVPLRITARIAEAAWAILLERERAPSGEPATPRAGKAGP